MGDISEDPRHGDPILCNDCTLSESETGSESDDGSGEDEEGENEQLEDATKKNDPANPAMLAANGAGGAGTFIVLK